MSTKAELPAMAKRIRQARKDAGFTSQAAFAEAAGVSKRSVELWEMGHGKPNADNLPRVARAAGVTSDFLLGDDAEEEAARLLEGAEQMLELMRHGLELALAARRDSAVGVV
jgi:transcriptional regulator with XRE-family HTH domain